MSDLYGAFRVAAPTADQVVWSRYGLAEIWQMVRDEDGVATYQQIGSWQFMSELCTDQAIHLQTALDQLMITWPPTAGSAAESFKAIVDDLIGSMRESAVSAKATIHPLIDITTHLAQAKDQVGELVALQERYLVAERTPAGGRGGQVSPPRPPEGWRALLDQKARAIMASTDIAIGKNIDLFQPPLPYAFLPDSYKSEPFGGQEGSSAISGHGTLAPPSFDPPAPASESGSRLGVPEPQAGQGWTDPILDGAFTTASPPESLGFGSIPMVSTASGPALAPGGVIGGPIPLPVGQGGPTSAGVTGTAVNPAGRSGGAPSMMSPMVGRGPTGTTGRPTVTSGGRRRRRSDPPDPWAAPAGVPAVLEPAPEPEFHDPGPGVIGIDR